MRDEGWLKSERSIMGIESRGGVSDPIVYIFYG